MEMGQETGLLSGPRSMHMTDTRVTLPEAAGIRDCDLRPRVLHEAGAGLSANRNIQNVTWSMLIF